MNTSNNKEPLEQLRDFRNFLFVVWKHLNLPNPTDLQYDIAEFMQHGPKRSVVMAFRGVGKSEGEFDDGLGELADAASALDFLQSHTPNSTSCWVIGFSFGSWIGMQLLMRRPEISGFVSVSPPANSYDFSFLAPCPSSGLIINGSLDGIVPPSDIKVLSDRLKLQKGIEISHKEIEGADHFFTNFEEEMTNAVSEYLATRSDF